jgi:hypothetical protein
MRVANENVGWKMNIENIAGAAAQLSAERKQRLLARLSFELTIAARDTYLPGSEDIAAPQQLRCLNEIQHRVTSCLLELLDNRNDDLWIWPVISEFAEATGCGAAVSDACVRALRSVKLSEQ